MTKKPKGGTLSTMSSSDKKKSPKEAEVAKKMKGLLGLNKIRFLPHANDRMGERNILDYEVRQALSNGRHEPKKDRYSKDWSNWEYCIEGKTLDNRHLRIGISFETSDTTGEKLLVITVIDLSK